MGVSYRKKKIVLIGLLLVSFNILFSQRSDKNFLPELQKVIQRYEEALNTSNRKAFLKLFRKNDVSVEIDFQKKKKKVSPADYFTKLDKKFITKVNLKRTDKKKTNPYLAAEKIISQGTKKDTISISFFFTKNYKIFRIYVEEDTDEDWFFGEDDECPNDAGSVAGCPDTDGDGYADKDDECPNSAMNIIEAGCPDSDGDGVHDGIDNCISKKGPPSNNGCPEATQEKIIKYENETVKGGGIEDEKVVPPPPNNAFYKEDGTINIPQVIGDSKKLEELIDTINAYENRKQLDEFDFQAYKDYGKAIFTAINQDRKNKGMPTLETSNETALIPGGAFIFGDAKNKNKSISLEVSEFLAVTRLITNEDYANFLNSYQGQYKPKSKEFKSRKDSGQAGNKLMLRLNPTYFDVKEIQEDSFVVIAKKGTAEEPITQVTWFGAYEFARHYGLWLPTEVQWEYLSKTYKEDKIRFPVGYSEWCQDKYSKGAIKDWKSKKKTQRDPEYPGDIDDRKVLRSSAYKARNFSLPESTDTNISFRCVVRTNTIGQ